MERKTPDDYESGTISLKGSTVIWHNDDLVLLQLDLADIIIIGEYTNSNGPWFDDWFLTFVTRDGAWRSIPWYAKNMEELLRVLSVRFHPALENSSLANSTSWKSVVRYPIALEGKELFNKVPSRTYKAPKNWFHKLLYSIGLGGFDLSYDLELTDPVKIELERRILRREQ
jgi:hypothetical protein